MTQAFTAHEPPPRRNRDTSAARLAARATFARRRHERYAREMAPYGVIVVFPPEYTGLPLDEADSGERLSDHVT